MTTYQTERTRRYRLRKLADARGGFTITDHSGVGVPAPITAQAVAALRLAIGASDARTRARVALAEFEQKLAPQRAALERRFAACSMASEKARVQCDEFFARHSLVAEPTSKA